MPPGELRTTQTESPADTSWTMTALAVGYGAASSLASIIMIRRVRAVFTSPVVLGVAGWYLLGPVPVVLATLALSSY